MAQATKDKAPERDMKAADDDVASNLPTTTAAPGSAPAFLQDKMKQDAGKGVSTDADDNIVPMINVLQGLSPQVNEQESAYIEGAKPGYIWMKNAPQPIIKGQDGFLFQSCYFYKKWVEWVPREEGGGFVANYDEKPKAAVEKPDPRDPSGKKMIWVMPNGNHLRETRYHAGRVHLPGGVRLNYVIPFSSTGHTVSRNWMFMMNSKRDADGNIYPSYASVFKLVTKMRKNKAGTWFVLEASDAGFIDSVADYEAGKAIYEAFAAGVMKAEAENDIVDEDGGGQHSDSDSQAM